jgi:hypothetical protein
MRITVLLLFVLILTSVTALTQYSINHITADEGITNKAPTIYSGTFYNTTKDLANSDSGTSIAGLPSSQSGGSTGGFFDMFTTFKSWLAAGGSFLLGMLTVPKDILFGMGMPDEIAWSLTIVLYVSALFLLVSWLRWNF